MDISGNVRQLGHSYQIASVATVMTRLLLLAGVGKRTRLALRDERQVIAHDVHSERAKNETNRDPETPIAMCTPPIRKPGMLRTSFSATPVRVIAVLEFSHLPSCSAQIDWAKSRLSCAAHPNIELS
jgi:hypothetical protein